MSNKNVAKMDSYCIQEDSTLESNDKKTITSETIVFHIRPYISLFEPFMAKNKIFSLKLMNKVLDSTRKFSSMDEKSFRHLESTVLFGPAWHPDCVVEHKMEILSRMLIHFFTFDDHSECDWGDGGRKLHNVKALWNQVLECLKKLMGEPVIGIDWEPYIWSFYSTTEVIFATYNDVQKMRFVREWEDYVDGNMNEAEHYKDNNWQSFKQMIKIREASIGIQTACQLIEYMNDIKLTDDEWLNENNQKMIRKASKWLVLVNDFTGFRSEWNECGHKLENMRNSIAILVMLEKLDLQQAVDKVIDLVELTEKQIIHYRDKFLADYSDSSKIKIYIKNVNQVMAGSWLCQHGIERYTGHPSEEGFRMEGKIEFSSDKITSKQSTKENFSKYLNYE